MPRVHTHYDNLKVTRDAPPEVIRAAYQALTKKHHPDKNPGDIGAQRVMALINAAYEALSDPARREQHDRWIRSMETGPDPVYRSDPVPPAPAKVVMQPAASDGAAVAPRQRGESLGRYIAGALAIVVIAVVLLWDQIPGMGSSRPGEADAAAMSLPPGPFPVPSTSIPLPQLQATVPGYVRPTRAPGGEEWPLQSDYVAGFKRLFEGGASTITLENRAGTDIYVKLYAMREARAFAVRWIYIKANDSFVIRDVRAGRYDIRYRDMDTGATARTDAFDLEEKAVAEGTRITNVKVALARPAVRDRAAGAGGEVEF